MPPREIRRGTAGLSRFVSRLTPVRLHIYVGAEGTLRSPREGATEESRSTSFLKERTYHAAHHAHRYPSRTSRWPARCPGDRRRADRSFQPTGGGKAAFTGDFVLTATEVKPVLRALCEHGIEVTASHNHMLDDQPRLFFMHFWAHDDAAKLATGLRAALDKINLARK